MKRSALLLMTSLFCLLPHVAPAATVFWIDFDLTDDNPHFDEPEDGAITSFPARGTRTIAGTTVEAIATITRTFGPVPNFSFAVNNLGIGDIDGDFSGKNSTINFEKPREFSTSTSGLRFLNFGTLTLSNFDVGDTFDLNIGGSTTTHDTASIELAPLETPFSIRPNAGSFRVHSISARFEVDSGAVSIPEPGTGPLLGLALLGGTTFLRRRYLHYRANRVVLISRRF